MIRRETHEDIARGLDDLPTTHIIEAAKHEFAKHQKRNGWCPCDFCIVIRRSRLAP